MHIPRVWSRTTADAPSARGRSYPISAWGWGDDEYTAKKTASNRLQRLLDLIRSGEPFPDKYGYGTRPLREEILQTIETAPGQRAAIVSRNGYGAQVLNTASLLFLDIDLQPVTLSQRLSRLFGGKSSSPETAALAGLRDVLSQYGCATFRIYRTAAGLRAIAIDQEFDPAADDTQQLMKATGTDPEYSRLCLAQRSFRARLTPKPWRCHCPSPPGEHPREDMQTRERFANWLTTYEKSTRSYATCRYLETVGNGSPSMIAAQLIEMHDRITRSDGQLPLA